MVRYLSMISFTDQGIQSIEESPARAKQFQSRVKAAGGKVIGQYWAVGRYDGFMIFEVPDEATGAALLLQLGKLDNVRTTTQRIFNAAEFQEIVNRTNG